MAIRAFSGMEVSGCRADNQRADKKRANSDMPALRDQYAAWSTAMECRLQSQICEGKADLE
jgi:hypothetical protein